MREVVPLQKRNRIAKGNIFSSSPPPLPLQLPPPLQLPVLPLPPPEMQCPKKEKKKKVKKIIRLASLIQLYSNCLLFFVQQLMEEGNATGREAGREDFGFDRADYKSPQETSHAHELWDSAAGGCAVPSGLPSWVTGMGAFPMLFEDILIPPILI